MFCGIDWASERHAVCVLDDAGHQATAFVIAHTADGFDQLAGRLRGYGDPAGLPVAIERPEGRLVDRLLEAGHPVVPVQPGAIKAWRDAEVLSGAKHDPSDAALIAEYLRLRHHRLRVLQPFSAQTRALHAVVRTRDDLIDQRVAAANQLGACLEGFWPGAKAIFADLASPIALDFLGWKAPSRSRPAATPWPRCCEPCWPRSRTSTGRWSPTWGAPRQRDLHVAATLGSDQRRPGARRVGRLPSSLRRRRGGRLPGRGDPSDQAVRQAQLGQLPLGLQQALPPGHLHLRRQLPARLAVGGQALR
jgi:hypothetical protein